MSLDFCRCNWIHVGVMGLIRIEWTLCEYNRFGFEIERIPIGPLQFLSQTYPPTLSVISQFNDTPEFH
jgi:hypothetical protein